MYYYRLPTLYLMARFVRCRLLRDRRQGKVYRVFYGAGWRFVVGILSSSRPNERRRRNDRADCRDAEVRILMEAMAILRFIINNDIASPMHSWNSWALVYRVEVRIHRCNRYAIQRVVP